MTVQSGIAFGWNYVDAGHATDLHVRANIWDITMAIPGTLVTTVVLNHTADGSYTGLFTPEAGKAYLIESLVYTDNTFATVDENYAGAAENIEGFDFGSGGGSGSTVFIGGLVGVIPKSQKLLGLVETAPVVGIIEKSKQIAGVMPQGKEIIGIMPKGLKAVGIVVCDEE